MTFIRNEEELKFYLGEFDYNDRFFHHGFAHLAGFKFDDDKNELVREYDTFAYPILISLVYSTENHENKTTDYYYNVIDTDDFRKMSEELIVQQNIRNARPTWGVQT